ncbi:protein-tyrosine-phosphatase [Paenibacillus sp. CCS19]|uniref:tyrosine-protein phosphatase n=1 Tax=Paenibacillus sp. CCS19 TaxID=3158387 RepID=UPI00256D7268|nr:tyrosine-protein phosphatase [Paenibacillus cellulosilyticus]GMK37820.1 protein-tyrosine-phosphatase [Paenibacillus cellulosilyticus]
MYKKLSSAILAASILLGAAAPMTSFAAPAAKAVQVKKQGQFTTASVERTSDGTLVVRWKASADLGAAKVYWSTSPDNIEKNGKLLAKTYTAFNGYVTADPNPNARIYFLIKGGNGDTIVTSERKVNLQGAFNFRDLGGYQTTDGKTVKWGKLFRGEELGHLTSSDLTYVHNMGLKSIVDYRTDAEVNALADPVIPGAQYIRTDEGNAGSAADLNAMIASGLLKDEASAVAMMVGFNKQMVDAPKFYIQLMELLNDPNNIGLVQHCTAGKDRTGLGSAIILLTLGVDEKTVMEDYLASNVYRAEANKKAVEAVRQQVKDENVVAAISALMGVQKEFLQAAIDEMKAKYGSIDNFIEQGLGITKEERAKLKAMYTE